MRRHQISAVDWRKVQARAEALDAVLTGRVRATPAQAARLQRNAADPEKARKQRMKRCPDCRGKRVLHGVGVDCFRCLGVGKIPVSLSVMDLTREREHVQPAIEDYLRVEGLIPIPINSGAATIIGGRACLKGVPDLVTWIPAGRKFMAALDRRPPLLMYPYSTDDFAVPCFVECKRPVGGRYSKEQITFRDRAIADGAIWIGATCKEDVMAVIPPKRGSPPPAAAARAGRAA